METRYIVAAITPNSISGRDILSGLFSYTEPGYKWRFRILQSEKEFSADMVRGALRDGADGFILTFLGDKETQMALLESRKPIVSMGATTLFAKANRTSLTLFRNDNGAIGRMGGEYLSSLGKFASYGFVHSKPGFHFSEERCAAFRRTLGRKVMQCPFREFWPSVHEGGESDISSLSAWIASLPKPSAVMAACDRRAIDFLAAAKRAGITVPGEVSLIGVDNDELLAENSEPPLTSILPGHFEMGFAAAMEMGSLLSSRKPMRTRTVRIPPKTVIERESAAALTPALALVLRAKKFIAVRATKQISTEDVVAHLGCSRNLADLRFKEMEGITVHAAIEKARLESVMHLVETTGRSVAAIAAQCGFKSANRLSHLFKERFGKSIREWRASTKNQRAQMEESVRTGKPVAERNRGHGTPFGQPRRKKPAGRGEGKQGKRR